MNTAAKTFALDLAKMNAALADFVRTADDGFVYIDPSAPADLVSAYRGLTQYGYANGLI